MYIQLSWGSFNAFRILTFLIWMILYFIYEHVLMTVYVLFLEGVLVEEPPLYREVVLKWRVGWDHEQVELKVMSFIQIDRLQCEQLSSGFIWLDREVELSVIQHSSDIKKPCFCNDRSLWWDVAGEEKWSKHWALRNARSKKLWLRNLTPPRHPTGPIWEVRLEPHAIFLRWTGGSGG